MKSFQKGGALGANCAKAFNAIRFGDGQRIVRDFYHSRGAAFTWEGMMSKSFIVCLSIVLMAGLACAKPIITDVSSESDNPGKTYRIKEMVNGAKRHYFVYVPRSYSKKRKRPWCLCSTAAAGTDLSFIKSLNGPKKGSRQGSSPYTQPPSEHALKRTASQQRTRTG